MRVPYRKPTKYTHIAQDPLLTEEKFNELKNKLEKLKNFSRPKAASEVKRLAELGDFSENVEYQLAKGRLRGINDNIVKIENHLKQAVIISPEKQTDTVQLGHTVTIEKNGIENTYQILGSAETDPQKGVISTHSPIGTALIGRKIGEIAKIKLAGKEVEYKIIKIK